MHIICLLLLLILNVEGSTYIQFHTGLLFTICVS